MNALEVLKGGRNWSAEAADALDWLRGLPSACVHLVFFSPPYEDARCYGETNFKLKGQAWVNWLRPIIVECARVSKGLVVVNMASPVKCASYSAAVEWLVADLTREDGLFCGPSPYCWVKSEDSPEAAGNGQPGSGGPYYHRRDWEPLYCFAEFNKLPKKWGTLWTDNTAFGKPPKYRAGGAPSHRDKHGVRANARGAMKHTKRGKSGMADQVYIPPKISNPGNVIRVPVGGGKLGCPIAHEGEAPMALGLAERFVRWYCPKDGIVCDPFLGTGTTCHAARMHERRFIGCDNRQSQVDLTKRRMKKVLPGVVLPKGAT